MIDFQKCTDRAYEILLEQHINCLIPIKIKDLELPYPVVFESLQNYSHITGIPFNILTANKKAENGCIYKHGNHFIVLHNELHCNERCNFTDGHEVGHIACGHKKDGVDEEVEAHFFSAQAIMPNSLIKYLIYNNFKITEPTIQRVFNVSPDAAKRKIKTLKKYFHAHRWDDDIIKKYQDSIDRYLYI